MDVGLTVLKRDAVVQRSRIDDVLLIVFRQGPQCQTPPHFLLVFGVNTAFAAKFATSARHAILIDAGTGEVLFEKNPDALMPPASMSKLMTMVIMMMPPDGMPAVPDDDKITNTNMSNC